MQKKVFIAMFALLAAGISAGAVWFFAFKGGIEETPTGMPQMEVRGVGKLVEEVVANKDKAPDIAEAEALTIRLYNLIEAYSATTAGNRDEIVKNIQNAAKERKPLMLIIAERSPNDFLRLEIPKKLRDVLPREAKEDIEEWVTKEGVTEVYAIHQIDDANVVGLVMEEGAFLLLSPDKLGLNSFISNTQIRVSGLQLDDRIFIPEPKEHIKTIKLPGANGASGFNLPKEKEGSFNIFGNEALAAAQPPTGVWQVAVILVNFSNDSSEPWTVAEMEDLFFNNPDSVKAYYDEASYGQIDITGSVFGYYNLPITNTNSIFTIYDEAIKKADPDITYTPYASVVVAFKKAGEPSRGTVGQSLFLTDEGMVTAGKVWFLHGSTHYAEHHEIGHNLGLHHAEAFDCGVNAVDEDPKSTCTIVNYLDKFTVMGVPPPSTFPHLNAPHKARLGWLSGTQVQEVSADGTYTIGNLENSAPGTMFLKIPEALPVAAGTDFYFLEYRQPVGFDSGFGEPSNYNGVLVHWETTNTPSIFSYLLDMTPGSNFGNSDFNDPALQVGVKYTDPNTGISFEPISKTPTQINVDVILGAAVCVRANPGISLAPASQSGAPGDTLSYVATVTNSDNSVCGDSTFTIDSNVSSIGPGWSSILAPTSLTLSPGASGTSDVDVTSPVSAADGFYGFRIRATNDSDPTFTSGSANNGQYVVVSGNNPPVVAILNPPDGWAFVSGSNVTFEGTADDLEDGDITPSLSWTSSINGPIGSGGTFTINTLSVGTHTITASVTDSGGFTASDSISISITAVPAVCGNNVAEGGEACDGIDLRGQTCASQGFGAGPLACNASCTAFDTSACAPLPPPPPPPCIAPNSCVAVGACATTVTGDSCSAGQECCQIATLTPGMIRVVQFINKLIDLLLVLVIGLLVLRILWLAFQAMTAGKDPQKLSSAKSGFIWAIAGILLIILVKVVIAALEGALGG